MVLIIVIVLITPSIVLRLQELEVAQCGIGRFQHLRRIAAILVSIHHRDIVGFHGDAGRDIGRDTGSHGLVAACLDQDDTIGTLRTVERGTVADDRHLLDVSRVDVVQHIIIETIVQQGAAILLVDDHVVDDDEWLGVHVQ